MRKYYVTRREVVTTATIKVVDKQTYEVSDRVVNLSGAFTDAESTLKAVNKNWADPACTPIGVVDYKFAIKTMAMTSAAWFDNAECIEETECTLEEAAAFGKRKKSADAE